MRVCNNICTEVSINVARCGACTRACARDEGCGAAGVDLTRLPDGSPCNPQLLVMVTGDPRPRNVQCRGTCFALRSAGPAAGICGSFLNVRVATSCPDTPDTIEALTPSGADNLAICLFRGCSRNADCVPPHVCRYPEDATGTVVRDNPRHCD